MMYALQIKELSFSYNTTTVLKDINLELQEGEFLALIGPNGGGKSTLLKLIVGLLSPSSGEILVFGKEPKSTYSQIGYVPQNTNQNIEFPISAIDVVLMGHNTKSRPLIGYGKDEIVCARGALAQVGMLDFSDKKIGSLSGGQRQRVMIARALCSNPKILILDEPTSNIDAEGQAQIYELLSELNKTNTIILVSHDISAVLDYATKIGYVNKTVTLHSAPNESTSSILGTLKRDDGHICEVEILQALSKRAHQCLNH